MAQTSSRNHRCLLDLFFFFFFSKPPSDVSSEVVFFFSSTFFFICRAVKKGCGHLFLLRLLWTLASMQRKKKEEEEACWMLFYHLAVTLSNAANSCSIKDSPDFLLHTHYESHSLPFLPQLPSLQLQQFTAHYISAHLPRLRNSPFSLERIHFSL